MQSPGPRSSAISPWRRCLLLYTLLCLLAPAAFADLWYQHYQRAEKALRDENWSEAVDELNQALQRRGEVGARVRTYGMKTTDYFPYLKLGIAYRGLGQLDAALAAFDTEERLEAVKQSERDYAELQRLRGVVKQEQGMAAAQEAARGQKLFNDNLDQARSLEQQGDLDGALSAAGRALALSPDDSQATSLMERLTVALRVREEAAEARDRANQWIEEGRDLLDQDRYSEAASLFRQALSVLAGEPEAERLLVEAQAGLRAQISTQEVDDRRATVTRALREARDFESAGSLTAALDRLQSVLALEPDNTEALSLQQRLLAAQIATELEASKQSTVAAQLSEAQDQFAAGRYERALATANRVLALEPTSSGALELVGRAYARINQMLLGRGDRGNLPPAIRFSDFRVEQEDGSSLQVVESSEFQLGGVVIDDSPVDVQLFSGDEEVGATVSSQPLGDFYITQFNLQASLDPGVTTYRLLATDSEESSSSGEYLVLFAPPWFRTWRLYAVAAAVLGLALATILLVRSRRQAQLRQRRFNPYVAGAPVLDENLFFGRQLLLDRILQTVHNNSLLLYGERRIGKTSIQHQLKKRLEELDDPRYEFYPVYVDLQGTPQERFFSTLAEDVFTELADVLGELEPVKSPLEDGYSYRDLVRDLRAVLRRLNDESSKQVKLVLLIDEVDELNDYDPRINQRLRSLFMKSFAENLVSVVSGVEIKKHWEREGSPWYNFFEEIEVRPFDASDARELIERPIEGVLKLEDGLVEKVIAISACKPYLIQKICIELVNRVYEQGRNTIAVSDLDDLARPESA